MVADQRLQPRLALGKGQGAQILALGEHQVEGEEDQIVGLVVRQRRLQRGEIRRAVGVQRHHFAVDQAVGQGGGALGKGREALGPVEALAGQELGRPVFDAQLDAIAVELDLVRPAGGGRRPVLRLAKLRLHEAGHGGGLGAGFRLAGLFRRDSLRHLGRGCGGGGGVLVRLPDGVAWGGGGVR